MKEQLKKEVKTGNETIEVNIQKKKKKWIVDMNGKKAGALNVHKGDTVKWTAVGSDMVFIFFDVDANFDKGNRFKNNLTQKIEDNETLELTVKKNLDLSRGKEKHLFYNVYVFKDDTAVIGNSPPKVIVHG